MVVTRIVMITVTYMIHICNRNHGAFLQGLEYKDHHWHRQCFVCHDCKVSLTSKPLKSKDELIYCSDCYDENFAERCDGCANVFKAGMLDTIAMQ